MEHRLTTYIRDYTLPRCEVEACLDDTLKDRDRLYIILTTIWSDRSGSESDQIDCDALHRIIGQCYKPSTARSLLRKIIYYVEAPAIEVEAEA